MAPTAPSSWHTNNLTDFFTKWRQLFKNGPEILHVEAAHEPVERLGTFDSVWALRRDVLGKASKPDLLTPRLHRFFAAWESLPSLVPAQSPPGIDWGVHAVTMSRFFMDLGHALRVNAEQRRLGTAINVWKASDLRQDELRNSKVLAWLLDCRGDHGQGAEMLDALLGHLTLKSNAFPKLATTAHRYWTRVESCHFDENDSRVDIEIDGESMLLFIEVKIDAKETTDQLDRYLKICEAKAHGRPWGLIYLTRHGKLPLRFRAMPDSIRLIPASWTDVVKVLRKQIGAMPDCIARSVFRQFAEHIDSFR